MRAFHGDQNVKNTYLSRVESHRMADEIIKGRYWERGKGCAVGCTIHGSNHKNYETELGIPEWLARVEDKLFEGMPTEDSKTWPERFLKAIHPGADLEKAKAPFLIFVLESARTKFDHEKYPKVLQSVDQVIKLYRDGGTKDQVAAADADAAYAAARRSARESEYKKLADKLIEIMEEIKP